MRRPRWPTRVLQQTGLLNRYNLYWSWYAPHNFGDWIGPYLYERITGRRPLYCAPSCQRPCTVSMAAGSILRKIKTDDVAIVWGSGIIDRADAFRRPLSIKAVRGPYSRERCLELGYDCPEVYGDPAILMPEFYRPAHQVAYGLGIVPHFVDYSLARERYARRGDVLVIDVTRPVEKVIDDILRCEMTVSSSLHGLILSHAYGKQAAWVRFSNGVTGDGVKFLDYLSAGGIRDSLTPTTPGASADPDELLAMVRDAPFPDNASLIGPLLSACPFPR